MESSVLVTPKVEVGFCEICDNYTPRVVVVEEGYSEEVCEYCRS